MKIQATNVNSQCAAMPAHKPPTVWLRIALPVKRLHFSASIMETCVERYPLQHMQIAVNTEMSFRIAFDATPLAAG